MAKMMTAKQQTRRDYPLRAPTEVSMPEPEPMRVPPPEPRQALGMKRGGAVRSKSQTKFASGGSVGSASKRADGIAQRGKTKGRYL